MKVYCLTLPEKPERTVRANEHFRSVGLGLVDWFEGLYGEVSGLVTTHTYELDNPGTNFRMGPAPVGIWLAHWALWSHILHNGDVHFYEHVMILEDDARFLDGALDEIRAAQKTLDDDFDFLFPGHCCLAGTEPERVAGRVYRTSKMQCNHCYITRPRALRFALKTLRKCYGPIDIQLQLEVLPYLKTYAIMPRVVDQFDTELPP